MKTKVINSSVSNIGTFRLPTLYKKTSTGAIQYWNISVIENSDHSTGYDIWTHYGQVGGKEQRTVDSIFDGKNVGKKNETSPKQQAESEATSKWEKQKKKGYVETAEAAQNDELDDLIEGGELPMLAEAYMDVIYDQRKGHENDTPQYIRTKESKKIQFPCYTQPKLDGIRCIAIIKDGACTLWSRTRKRINSVPHIVQELEAAFERQDIVLDGELYNHDMKSDFEKIVSLVRQEEPGEGHEIVQYHVYDIIDEGPFSDRSDRINILFRNYDFYSLKQVKTELVGDEFTALNRFEKYVAAGYEGAMLRNRHSVYNKKRSMDLQKLKPFIDAEFSIVGVKEGRGKLAGHAIFSCEAKNGNPFDVKLKGETSNLKQYLEDESTWRNKELTVRYQGLTNKEKVPRFPVGLAVRDYE